MTEQTWRQKVAIQQRLSQELLDAIDERRRAVGLSRNEWIARALAWAVEQPVREVTVTERT